MQQKEIKYTGITARPSDYSCPDGDLSTAINVTNEDGCLLPIKLPEVIISSIDGKLIYTHHTSSITHYLIIKEAIINAYTINNKRITLVGLVATVNSYNKITSVGNSICISTDEKIIYSLWNGIKYSVFDTELFKYDIFLESKLLNNHISVYSNMGENFPNGNPITEKESREVFNSIDAAINKKITDLFDKYTFKYISFGVAALKLYDGTYCSLSNIFIISSKGGVHINREVSFNSTSKTVSCQFESYKEIIKVSMDTSGIEDIISSIDIFLTPPTTLFDIDKAYGISKNRLTYQMLVDKKLYDSIDGMIFRKSISIEKDKFGKEVNLESVSQTNEFISLVDFKRNSFGAKYAFSYNNRLNIANVKKTFLPLFDIGITINIPSLEFTGGGWVMDQDDRETWVSYEEARPYGNLYGQYADSYKIGDIEKNEIELIKNRTVEAIVIIYAKIDSIERIFTYNAQIQYPLHPFFMFPDANAYKAEILIYDSLRSEYRKKTIDLYKSTQYGMSFHLNTDSDGFPTFMQYNSLIVHEHPQYGMDESYYQEFHEFSANENQTFSPITTAEFDKYKNSKESTSYFDESCMSPLRKVFIDLSY